MPYKTGPSTGGATDLAFSSAWIGLAANLALLASYLMGAPALVTSVALPIVAASILIVIFSGPLDEHFCALRDAGLKWGMAVIALYLFASAMLVVGSGAHSLGAVAAGGSALDPATTASGIPADGFLVAILAALGFHLGFAIARLRGTRGA